MPLAVFSMLHIVSYVFEGLIILIALEISYGVFAEFFGLVEPIFDDLPVLVALIIAYALGQANSTIAHLLFQDMVTSAAFHRPSSYFLALLRGYDGEAKADGRQASGTGRAPSEDEDTARKLEDVHKLFGSKLMHRLLIHHWKAFEDRKLLEKFKSLADDRGIDCLDERFDRKFFAIGLSRATSDKGFNETTHSLLLHFNFSRNMFCALLISFLLIFLPEFVVALGEFVVRLPELVSCLPILIVWLPEYVVWLLEPSAAAGAPAADAFFPAGRWERDFLTDWEFVTLFLVVMVILLRRYLYFMGVITKKVLLSLAESQESQRDETATLAAQVEDRHARTGWDYQARLLALRQAQRQGYSSGSAVG